MKHSTFFYRTLKSKSKSLQIAKDLLADTDFISGKGFKTFTRFGKNGKHLPYREENSRRTGNAQHPKAAPGQKLRREEEYIAMDLFLQSKANGGIPKLGIVLDYQTPLSGTADFAVEMKSVLEALNEERNVKHMCVDLIAYDTQTNEMRILELKRPDSKEPLLRSVVEGYTYLQVLDKDAFYKDMLKISDEYKGLALPEKMPVFKAYSLLFSDSAAEAEYHEAVKTNNEMLQLMNALDVHPIFIDGTAGKYKVK